MFRKLWNFITSIFKLPSDDIHVTYTPDIPNIISMRFADDDTHKIWCSECGISHVMLNICCIGCLGYFVAPKSRKVQAKCNTIYRCPTCQG